MVMKNPNMKLDESNHLSLTRATVKPGSANLLPKTFTLDSLLPEWANTKAYIYAAPLMGADFIEVKLDIEKDGGSRERIENPYENFLYVIRGEAEVNISGTKHNMEKEGYCWLPPGVDFEIQNRKDANAEVLWLRKRYQETKFFPVPDMIISSVLNIEPIHSIAEEEQQCLPFEKNPGFDMAMNMLTFFPGVTFPFTETHVFEHGGYFLDGRGNFWINGENYEVHEDDFCYMAPFAPHYVVAYGPEPLRYLLYKPVNRDFSL
jgi:(S)-ureidoglycine aminohydrolase